MLLEGLTEEEQALVAGICKMREVKPGQKIVSEGEPGGTLLLLRKGRAEVRKSLDGKIQKYLKELKAGEFFGEMCFLHKADRSASVIAIEKCEVLELDGRDFDRLVRKLPDIGLKVYKNIAQELVERLNRNNEDLKKAVLWAIEGANPH